MIFEKAIVNAFKGIMHVRCDDTETVFYFSHNDFPNLKNEDYDFYSSMGHVLKGHIYEYEGALSDRLIIFDHGFGGGHRAYRKEIEKLCSHGYRVFAYDHTGCMTSGGESSNGLAQSLCDLNDCVGKIKSDERFKDCSISVMGHSWGAFSSMNIAKLHPSITHVVAISGFVSVKDMIDSSFTGILKGYRRAVLESEISANPEFALYNAVDSLKSSPFTKALLIYSEDDHICSVSHYEILKAGLSNCDNVTLVLTNNKRHNPNFTEDAVKYVNEFSRKRAKLKKKRNLTDAEKKTFVDSFDWNRMTAQDEDVWNMIFTHLESK